MGRMAARQTACFGPGANIQSGSVDALYVEALFNPSKRNEPLEDQSGTNTIKLSHSPSKLQAVSTSSSAIAWPIGNS
jgi:hypothetical protein